MKESTTLMDTEADTPKTNSSGMLSPNESSHHESSNGGDLLIKSFDKISYDSPPVARNVPENNQVKIIEYRGAKVASFIVDGKEVICLPQAFELFLKHLVGGLHTVYTKLKRLEITPIVCNVEQVRILRGLGAIQPGVNRCKLLSPKEFDILYEDCTNSSARPGRPPKRNVAFRSSPDLMKPKKSKVESDYEFSGGYHNDSYLNGNKDFRSSLMTNGYSHYAAAAAFGLHPYLNPFGYPTMVPPATLSYPFRAGEMTHSTPEIKKHSEPENLSQHNLREDGQQKQSAESSGSSSDRKVPNTPHALSVHALVGGRIDNSKADDHLSDVDDNVTELSSVSDDDRVVSSSESNNPSQVKEFEAANERPKSKSREGGQGDSSSSSSPMDSVLMNIQNLVKIALENVRKRERQSLNERAEMNLELMKEKELREALEKQLAEQMRAKDLLMHKLKRERRDKLKLEELLKSQMAHKEMAKSPYSSDASDSDGSRKSEDSVRNGENRYEDTRNGVHDVVGNFLVHQTKKIGANLCLSSAPVATNTA